eukprot:1525350-Alexandrium_andersonii.AAC.1
MAKRAASARKDTHASGTERCPTAQRHAARPRGTEGWDGIQAPFHHGCPRHSEAWPPRACRTSRR